MSTIIVNLSTPQERLKYLVDLKANGIAADFAREIGVQPATFHNYLKGRAPSFEALVGLRSVYSININWFINGKGEMYGDSCGVPDKPQADLTIDLEVLHRIIKWVEEYLVREKKTLTPDKKARFVALAYKCFTTPREDGVGRDVSDRDMNDWLRLVV